MSASADDTLRKEAAKDYYTTRMKDPSLPVTVRLANLDSLARELPGKNIGLQIRRGEILLEGCRYDEAYRDFLRIYRNLPSDSLRLRNVLLHRLAQSAIYGGHYRVSSNHCIEILRLEKPDSMAWSEIEAYSILVAIDAYHDKNAEILKKYYAESEKALERMIKGGADENLIRKYRIRRLIMRALIAGAGGDVKEEFRLYREARAASPDSATIDGLNNNIGMIYFRLKDYDKARQYLQQAFSSHRPGTARVIAAYNYINSYLEENKSLEARQAFDRLKPIFSEIENTPFEWKYCLLHYKVHAANGEQLEAIPYLEQAVTLLDSIHSPHNEVSELNVANEVTELLLEQKYADRLSSSRLKTKGLIVLCVALVLTLGAGWWLHRKARRREDEVEVMAMRLDESVSRHVEETRQIGNSLQMKGQELSSLSLRNKMLRHTIDKIVGEIHRLSPPGCELSKKATEAIKELSAGENASVPKRKALESVHQSFFDELYRLHPDLTNAEREMCAYALMGFTPKEIAAMTSRSVKTVNCIRHNMRKKLGISAKESTENYLRSLCAEFSGSATAET